jgi:predicted deacylase
MVDVGQSVKEDDVVALVETDKVTVEIKASQAGVVTQRFGQVYVRSFLRSIAFLQYQRSYLQITIHT